MDIRIHPQDPVIQIDATLAFESPFVVGIMDDQPGFEAEISVCVEDIPALIEMLQKIVEGN